MKILIEGEKYSITQLEDLFDDPKFYSQNGVVGTMTSVGYHHSFTKNQLVYVLPKVFIQNALVFGRYTPDELISSATEESLKHKSEYKWARQLSIFFYNSLVEFRKRFPQNLISEPSQSFEINSNLGENEYSYLDLVLGFTNFYKKNKAIVLFYYKEQISNQHKKVKWDKTVRSATPLIFDGVNPIYLKNRNNKKNLNINEELICYYFSILNYFNEEHQLDIQIDKSFQIIKGEKFRTLQKVGLKKLREIKYKYFSDTFKRMHQLCELYFSKTDLSSVKRKKEEYISVRNYNIVFEDMVDKLFSDKIDETIQSENVSLNELKYNKDGKIIDHIFEYQSLIDSTNIFYIGDSKYYKSDSEAGSVSTFKQFTYAKNVVQFNINLFNQNGEYYNSSIKYRDEITEGYNPSPNFFIYGYIDSLEDFNSPKLTVYKSPKKSYHFRDRLFDRDTLFVHQYRINFLFVLKSYTHNRAGIIAEFRKNTKKEFRNQFVKYFNTKELCEFELFIKEVDASKMTNFVNINFKVINGKCIRINNDQLLIARHISDSTIDDITSGLHLKILS